MEGWRDGGGGISGEQRRAQCTMGEQCKAMTGQYDIELRTRSYLQMGGFGVV
jgi:hypothetical protein